MTMETLKWPSSISLTTQHGELPFSSSSTFSTLALHTSFDSLDAPDMDEAGYAPRSSVWFHAAAPCLQSEHARFGQQTSMLKQVPATTQPQKCEIM